MHAQLRDGDREPMGTSQPKGKPQQALAIRTIEARHTDRTGSGSLEYAQWALSLKITDLSYHKVLSSRGDSMDKSGDNGVTQSGEDIKPSVLSPWREHIQGTSSRALGAERLIDGSGLPLDQLCGLEQDKPCGYWGAAQFSAVNLLQPSHNFRGADPRAG